MHDYPITSRFAAIIFSLCCALAMISGAQAGLIFAGGDGEYGYPAFGRQVNSPAAAPSNFLAGGPTLYEPRAIAYGRDGNIYVLEGEDYSDLGPVGYPLVYKYSRSGQYMSAFIGRGTYGSGPSTVDLTVDNNIDPVTMAIGPDGNLYMAIMEGDSTLAPFPAYGDNGMVLRFNGQTGAYMGIFVANGAGDSGNNEQIGEPKSLAFDTDGNLYVGNTNDNEGEDVLKFDSSGAYVSTVIASTYGLDEASGLTFHNGKLYVANQDGNNVLQVTFNPNGSVNNISEFVAANAGGLEEPLAIAFGPDGHFYAISSDNEAVLRFNGSSGAFMDSYVTAGDTANYDPYGFIFKFDEPSVIPTLGQWSMIATAVLLLAAGGYWLRRRNRQHV